MRMPRHWLQASQRSAIHRKLTRGPTRLFFLRSRTAGYSVRNVHEPLCRLLRWCRIAPLDFDQVDVPTTLLTLSRSEADLFYAPSYTKVDDFETSLASALITPVVSFKEPFWFISIPVEGGGNRQTWNGGKLVPRVPRRRKHFCY